MTHIAQMSHDLGNEEALALQQIYENEEITPDALARQLGMTKTKVMRLIETLRHKHLIAVKRTYEELWLNLNTEGRRVMKYIWPEFVMSV